MKISRKNILIVATLGVFVLCAFTVNIVTPSEKMVNKILSKNAGTKPGLPAYIIKQGILIEDIPQMVKSAVISKYAAYTIHRIYQEEEGIYKLVLKNGGLKLITYYSADGEYLRQETIKSIQMVKL